MSSQSGGYAYQPFYDTAWAQSVVWGLGAGVSNGTAYSQLEKFGESDTRPSGSPVSYMAITQASIIGCVVLGTIARRLLPRPPAWLRTFAQDEDCWNRSFPYTLWTLYLLVVGLAGLVSAAVLVFMTKSLHRADFVHLFPWNAAFFMTARRRPTSTPKRLLVMYGTIMACSLASLVEFRLRCHPIDLRTILNIAFSSAALLGILAMPMRDPSLSREGIASNTATVTLRSPEDNLTLWQFMTVSWLSPLIKLGSKQRLNDENVWMLPYEFQHSRLHLLFRDLRGSILRRLIQANGLDLVIISFLGMLETTADLSVPLLLKYLLQSIQAGRSHLSISVTFAGAILLVRLASCQSSVFSLWFSRRCYERSRGEMITTIYAKTLARKTYGESTHAVEDSDDGEPEAAEQAPENPSWTTRVLRVFGLRRDKNIRPKKDAKDKGQPATTGKILNLMRSDVYEVAQRFWDFPQFVTQPLKFVLSFVLILHLLGWPSLLGLAAVVFAQALNALVIRRLLALVRARRTATDERLQATTQLVEALRHLRWYDWQDRWVARVMRARQRELDISIATGLWSIAMGVVNIASALLFPVIAFFAYTYVAGRPLTVEVAFPALQVFNMLESSFRELPGLVTVLLNANIAMGRIEGFMGEPDKDEASQGSGAGQIVLTDASFAWPGRTKPVLCDLNLQFPPGLTVVFGKVGSGKTALLQAILGELDCQKGLFVVPDATIGYCAQLPWLQHMSIRDNILFSSPHDPQRYSRVLDACALLPDLASFKNGDLSDIGENGIGLSGGQKARVALARAVYSDSPILLLDDPLAALDHHTADSIVRKLLQGDMCKGRTIILVTHRVDLCLHLATQMIEVEDGYARALDSEEADREVAKFMREEEVQMATEEEQAATNEASPDAIPDKFVEEEHRASGGVMLSVYWSYIKAGTLPLWAVLVVMIGFLRLGSLVNYWFLKSWGEAYGSVEAFLSTSRTLTSQRDLFDGLPNPGVELKPWLLVYLGIALAQILIHIIFQCFVLLVIYTAAKGLFARVVDRVSRATFRFYDVTPVGRLMNRLVSDIGMIDGGIIGPLQQVAWWAIAWVSSMLVIASAAPVFLVFSIGMTLWFFLIFRQFLPTSQSLRRLEMVSLSPLMSNFGILLDGLTTIRAFRAQPHFQNRNITVTDAFQKMDHFYWSLQAWLMYRFDALSAVSTFSLTLLALYHDLSPGLTAFVLTTASQFVQATHALCKQYGALQMDFVSVERVIELLYLQEEPQGKIKPPAIWPSGRDDVVFDDVTIRYADHLDPSLSNVSFTIPGGSTCAVLGRTGSGKSTMALALLATMHPTEGSIHVGSMNLSEVDVHAWRQRISFVAQDPVLFPGTLRENLDPLEQFTDAECIAVLHRILGPEWDLQSAVEGGGKNLSQGQRQLVGIGRAVLRRSAVVILDEATASIDKETAAQVQDVLREELSSSTVITIAHRLEAVKDANYFIRLDAGRVVEHGPTSSE